MLVDFCHYSLRASVSCDKPCSDGYEVQNLVSQNTNKGFLAEYFVKPPVSVTFTFPCKISIHHIIISPTIGQQKSTSVEIYTAAKRIDTSWLGPKPTGRRETTLDSPLFLNIGKATINDLKEICFVYPRFVASHPYSVDPENFDNYNKFELRNSRYQYITAVSDLTVRIVRTQGSCIPALKSVKIWGQPALSNGKDILERVLGIYLSAVTPVVGESYPKEDVKPREDFPSTSTESADAEFTVPEDFLDPITCDIMALPMLLPCGKSLDQCTLDKYIDTEASWGRQPNDPFTGVTFSATSKPIPNDSLKVRIDTFVMQNVSNEKLKDIPRTLGRKEASTGGHFCSKPSTSNQRVVHKRTTDLDISGSQSSKKRLKTEVTSSVKERDHFHQGISQTEGAQSKGHNSVKSSHESCLQSTLSDALSVLNDLPSFTKKAKINSDYKQQEITQCSCCSVVLDKTVTTYKLVCSHYICRSCLLKPGSSNQIIQCHLCEHYSDMSRVLRFHVT